MGSSDHTQLDVLVVDDDPGMRDLLVDIVTKAGHQAVPASSAEEILKLLPYWSFQAAFIDHHLPGMEGLVLAEYLKRTDPDLSISVITGSNESNLNERCARLGIGLIAKPFKVGEVEDVLDGAVLISISNTSPQERPSNDNFAPPVSGFADGLTGRFDIPSAPNRIESRLLEIIKLSLNNLRSEHRFNEEDRVIAFSGLITSRVLGIKLPKAPSGRTLYEEYDAMMREHGRRTEFEN